jgi:PAS domain S-box-containing protein
MRTSKTAITTILTIRYLFALGLIASLAATNYWLLATEMRVNEESVNLLALSGRQRTLLQSTALLSQAIVSAGATEDRPELIQELRQATEKLEQAHHRLIEFPPIRDEAPLRQIRRIYDSAPWLLDTEIRNYLTQLRELSGSEEDQLHFLNPHYRYVRDVAIRGEVMEALEEVVKVYQAFSESRAAKLRRLARFSIWSTLVVILLTGVLVFKPMISRVRSTMEDLGRLNDTLEAKVAERTREAETRAAELLESEALYHSLVESLPLGIVKANLSGRITFANKQFLRICAKPVTAIVGVAASQLFEELFRTQGTDQGVLPSYNDGCTIGSSRVSFARNETQLFEVMRFPVNDASQKTVGSQILVWDISDRQAAEERMLRAERLAAIGEMTAGVAHESRNALQQIKACSKMLEWELGEDRHKQSLVGDIQVAHNRLHRLFESLRGYATPLRLQVQYVDLREVVSEAWKNSMVAWDGRACRIGHVGGDVDTVCCVDAFQIEQVFRNIFDNSIALTGDPVEISINWSDGILGGLPALVMAISDNGPGMTVEVQERIFDPFFTLRQGGTGLGMAIVRRIVDAHGGSVQATFPEGSCGACIEIVLPRAT